MARRMSRDDFVATLDLSRVDARHAHDSTLEPTMAPLFRGGGKTPLARPRASAPIAPPEPLLGTGSTIRIKGPLAEGGMGVIKLAEQGGLRRDVAVKTLRDDLRDDDFIARLTREARITGLVEHPNIVPIYALQLDERGAPLMVMKRIEGVSWRALMRDPAHPSGLVDAHDALVWHLSVLLKVCDAIHYAHSRGILHLDLKPDNVMVGHFRDVYVVDWGVAVSTRPEHRGFLPLVDEIREVLGTPAYIAPEMVDVGNGRIGVHSDVYLLGGVLHEILTGHPPHKGGSLRDTLFAAYEAESPTYGPDVPAELAAIATQALDPQPGRRHGDVEQFRRAIEGYLQHRSSASLSAESRRLLDELTGMLRDASLSEDASSKQVLRRFSECRFGFAQALREWPDNPQAIEGMVEATLLLAGYHLDRSDASAAESMLHELRAVPPQFARRVAVIEEGIRLMRGEDEKLRQLGAEMDDVRSRRARAIYVIILAVILISPLTVGWVLQMLAIYEWAWWHSVLYTGTFVVVASVTAWGMRDTLMPNRLSRRYITTLCYLFAMILAFRTLSFQLGYRDMGDGAVDVFVFGVGCGVIGMLTDRRFMAVSVAFVAASICTSFFPNHLLLFMTLAGIAGPGVLAALWFRSDVQHRRRLHQADVVRRSFIE